VTTAAGIFNDDPDAMPPDFSQHSIAVAAGTTVAATVFGISSGDAMCAGLLHDLGSALAYRFARDRYEQLVDDADRVTLAEREQEAFGADHAALGAFALEAWKLPRLIVDAIRCHHDDPSGVANRLAGAIIAGEALARHANPDAGFSHEIALPPDVAFSSLGNPNAAIDTLVERTIETTAELESLLIAR
jgi:putative nucleotidyltransferase with HDIG domain